MSALAPLNLDHSALPNIARAKLPAMYEGAKTALAECARLDECQSWADKAAAMASYAKQADDMELHQLADRIKARAIKRCGELLREIEAATNQHDAKKRARDGGAPSRTQVASDAGMSERQRKTALRVAAVPTEEFERLVESDDPPTVTQLADMGRQRRPEPLVDLGGRDPKEFALATQIQGQLRDFATRTAAADIDAVIRGTKPHEIAAMRAHAETAAAWLAELQHKLRA